MHSKPTSGQTFPSLSFSIMLCIVPDRQLAHSRLLVCTRRLLLAFSRASSVPSLAFMDSGQQPHPTRSLSHHAGNMNPSLFHCQPMVRLDLCTVGSSITLCDQALPRRTIWIKRGLSKTTLCLYVCSSNFRSVIYNDLLLFHPVSEISTESPRTKRKYKIFMLVLLEACEWP